MTTLTMAQRRADFETMLKRADLARATVSSWRATEINVPGKPIAKLARDVAELCAAWLSAAHRAHAHNPGDHAQRRAVAVAADCLLLLDDIGVADPVKEVADASVDNFLGPLTWREDLYLPAVERISRLLAYLGDVAENYDYGTDDGCRLVLKEVTELLAAKSICAALAAERGLWQEEES